VTGEKPTKKKAPEDKLVEKGLECVIQKWNDEFTTTMYKLIVFTGLRPKHAFKLLTTWDKSRLEILGKVAVYDTEGLFRGRIKQVPERLCMPTEFARKLKKFRSELKAKTYEDRLNISDWKTKPPGCDIPKISAQFLRVWFENFMKRHDIEPDYRKYFMGHSIPGVTAKHYEDIVEFAPEEYEKIVDKFPIPA